MSKGNVTIHVIKKIVDVDGRFSTSNNEDLGNFRNEFISVRIVIDYLYVFNISTVRCLKLHKCKMRTCRTCEWGKRTMLIMQRMYALSTHILVLKYPSFQSI